MTSQSYDHQILQLGGLFSVGMFKLLYVSIDPIYKEAG